MMTKHTPSHRAIAGLILTGLAGAYIVSRWNSLLFHMAIEGFLVMAAALIYILATRTYKFTRDGLLHFLGASCLCTAALISLHLLTLPNMKVFDMTDFNLSTQLWVATQAIQAAVFLSAPGFIRRSFANNRIAYLFTGLTLITVLSVTAFHLFPVCTVANHSTRFKTTVEIFIDLLLIAAFIRFYINRKRIFRSLYRPVMLSIVATLFSGFCFTSTIDYCGILDFLGYLLYAFAGYQLYRGIVLKGLEAPYQTIFAELKECATTDPLTGLLNRLGFNDLAHRELDHAVRLNRPFALLYLDVDNFKKINDQYGHSFGDDVLKQIARLLRSSLRDQDTACRLGGDEFAVILGTGAEELSAITQRIETTLKQWFRSRPTTRILGISIGGSLWKPGDPPHLQSLIDKADEAMYQEKSRNKLPTRSGRL